MTAALALALVGLFGSSLGQANTALTHLTAAPVTTAVFQRVSEAYFDPSRFDYGEGLDQALRSLEVLVPEFQADYKPGEPVLKAQMNLARKSFNVGYMTSIPAALDVLKKVYGFIQENLQSEVDPAEIEYAASNGFLTILDPHSRLLPPRVYKEFMVTTSGSFGGLGIVIGIRENALTVISPLDGTPAARAGLKAGDKIIRIEDESTENMPLDEAVKRLRGPEGTVVHLTILRQGEAAPIPLTLTRAQIIVPSVEGELLEGGVGYVRLTSFQENTARDLQAKLADLRGQTSEQAPFRGLVLDLRNNPGGLLDQAIEVADLFLHSGTIVSTVTRANRTSKRAHQFRTEGLYPIVVLVNEGSASASEIVAGALRNHDRALVVGARTFGKGSVQNIFELPLGAALKLTVAQYLTPGDESIQSVGVMPNLRLLPVELTKDEVRMSVFQQSSREENLERHLDGITQSRARADEEISFLVDHTQTEPSAEDAAAEENPSALKVDLNADYPAALARRLVLGAKSWPRTAVLESNRALLDRERAQALGQIASALGRRGLDWSGGKTALPVSIDAKAQVLGADGKPRRAAVAGEKLHLELQVGNRGRGPLHQLRVTTESDVPFLDHREFVFGLLAPGATVTQRIPFEIATGTIGRTSGVKFSFLVDDRKQAAEVELPVRIDGKDRPSFSLSYELFDGGKAGKAKGQGNGDGQINPGEQIALKVRVRNTGTGESSSSTLRLRSMGGPLVDIAEGEGTHRFEKIAPNAESEGWIYFTVKDAYLEAKVPLEISLFDAEYRVGFSRDLALSVVRWGGPVPTVAEVEESHSRIFSPPRVSVEGVGPAGLESSGSSLQVGGELLDDVQIRDFYISVNGEKTYYRSYQGAAAVRLDKFKFKVDVPLEPGSNFVLIVVRDNDNLANQYPLYIWRPGPPAAVGEVRPKGERAKAHP